MINKRIIIISSLFILVGMITFMAPIIYDMEKSKDYEKNYGKLNPDKFEGKSELSFNGIKLEDMIKIQKRDKINNQPIENHEDVVVTCNSQELQEKLNEIPQNLNHKYTINWIDN